MWGQTMDLNTDRIVQGLTELNPKMISKFFDIMEKFQQPAKVINAKKEKKSKSEDIKSAFKIVAENLRDMTNDEWKCIEWFYHVGGSMFLMTLNLNIANFVLSHEKFVKKHLQTSYDKDLKAWGKSKKSFKALFSLISDRLSKGKETKDPWNRSSSSNNSSSSDEERTKKRKSSSSSSGDEEKKKKKKRRKSRKASSSSDEEEEKKKKKKKSRKTYSSSSSDEDVKKKKKMKRHSNASSGDEVSTCVDPFQECGFKGGRDEVKNEDDDIQFRKDEVEHFNESSVVVKEEKQDEEQVPCSSGVQESKKKKKKNKGGVTL